MNSVTAVTSDFLLAKVDHSFDDRNKLTGRYMTFRQDTDPSSVYPDAGADTATHNRGGPNTDTLLDTDPGSAIVNDLRYTYVNRSSLILSGGVGGGLPGEDRPRRSGSAGLSPVPIRGKLQSFGIHDPGATAVSYRAAPVG